MISVRTEWVRKSWHVATGIVVTPFVLYTESDLEHVPPLTYVTLVALAATFFVLAIELLHLLFAIRVPFWTGQLQRVRRPEENFSWASLGFLLTVLALLWVAPTPVAIAAAGMLAFGDSFSALVGRSLGRHKIPWNRQKSWEGSAAGYVAGLLGSFALIQWYAADKDIAYPLLLLAVVLVVGAAAAMLAESFPRLEDNITVPAFSGGVMFLVWSAVGLDPATGPAIHYLFP